jgi:hypothetical protein
MLELQLENAELKTVNGHRYYVFPAPPTHTNQNKRPQQYADVNKLKTYMGRGSNGVARLLPDVLAPADLLMSALRDYGTQIDDWSLRSAVIHNGYRPDDATQGANYLRIIKLKIAENNPPVFPKGLTFPSNLEADAQGVLGKRGDSRREAFRQNVAASPGWTQALMQELFNRVDRDYAPRGFNPHSTGYVFDLDFSLYYCGQEKKNKTCVDRERMLGTDTHYNGFALRSAVGMWLNTHAMHFGFDSYDTSAEVFHLEYRK